MKEGAQVGDVVRYVASGCEDVILRVAGFYECEGGRGAAAGELRVEFARLDGTRAPEAA